MGELIFGRGKTTFSWGEMTLSWGEMSLSWGETTLSWGETDLGQNDRNSLLFTKASKVNFKITWEIVLNILFCNNCRNSCALIG